MASKVSSRAATRDNEKSLLDDMPPAYSDEYQTPNGDDSVNQSSSEAEDQPLTQQQEEGERGKRQINLFTLGFFGIIVQYATLGLVYGFFAGLVMPIFSAKLNLPSGRAKSSVTFINFCWSMKVFIAGLIDTKPIFGYSRKFYCLFGWMLSGFLMLFTIFYVGQPDEDTDPLVLTGLRSE
eukprot:UN03147